MCRDADFHITVTLVHRETDWAVVHVEPGDQSKNHCGLAVDYGSTTIVMQLIDMNSGTVIDQVKAVNKSTFLYIAFRHVVRATIKAKLRFAAWL